MSLPLLFVLVFLSTWRISRMIAFEEGPWGVFTFIRFKLGDSQLGIWMGCPYCSSVSLAPLVLLVGISGPVGEFVVMSIAVSAMVVALTGIENYANKE